MSTACATMKGSGFPKGETLVSPFGGASFGTFLPLVGEKYLKAHPNLKKTYLKALSFAEGKTRLNST